MANVLYPLLYGPTGNDLVVDASGRLIATGDSGSDRYVLGYGSTGRSLVVDASGRLILSSLSPGIGGTAATVTDIVAGSGIQVDKSGTVFTIQNTNDDDLSAIDARVTSLEGFTANSWVAQSVTNGPVTIDLDGKNLLDVDLDADCTLTFSNPVDGAKYMLLFVQASGNNTVAWESRVAWVGGAAPTITAASGSKDVVTLLYNSRLDIFLADVAADIS